MRTPDLYTKIVLTIIAVFLGVLCVEQSHWIRVESVHAESPQQVVISGYVWHKNGKEDMVLLGSQLDKGNYNPGIPVFIQPAK